MIAYLIAQFPDRSDVLADVPGYVTHFQFALLLSAIALPAISFALRRRQGRSTTENSATATDRPDVAHTARIRQAIPRSGYL